MKLKNNILSFKTLNKAIGFIIIFQFVFYLYAINDLAIKGFEIKELKKKLHIVNEDNMVLESRVAYLESYNNISKKTNELNMVAVGDVDYLLISTTETVAKK